MKKVQVFEFSDQVVPYWSSKPSRIEAVDINLELTKLMNQGYEIKSVQLTVLPNHKEDWEKWDKRIYTVVVEK